jgi:predicted TIM-barrel fold metal-dependent hydrolase
MEAEAIQAIDVHAHYGDYKNSPYPLIHKFMSASAAEVVERARQSHTCLTIASPLQALMPRMHNDAVGGNEAAVRAVEATPGLLQWVVIDPRKAETYRQAEEMLRHPKCVGIKIHPEEHVYHISDHGRAIFEFAAEHKAIVLTHSGEENSLPMDFVPFMDDYPEATLILAHLGCGYDSDPSHQVRAVQAQQHGNIYIDTSSARNILANLVEWAVGEVGAERLLYGTDTPLYFVPMQRIRIDRAEISDDAKRAILRDNATRLFNFPESV